MTVAGGIYADGFEGSISLSFCLQEFYPVLPFSHDMYFSYLIASFM